MNKPAKPKEILGASKEARIPSRTICRITETARGDHPMLKSYLWLSLLSIAILAVGIPLSAAAYIALALIGY